MTPIPGAEGSPRPFLDYLTKLLADPAASLTVTGDDILCHADTRVLNRLLDEQTGRPKPLDTLLAGKLPDWPGTLRMLAAAVAFRHKHASFRKIVPALVVELPVLSINDREFALLRTMAALYHHDRLLWPDWYRFYTQLVCGSANARTIPPAGKEAHKHIDDARSFVKAVIHKQWPSHDEFIAITAKFLAAYANEPSDIGRTIAALINPGARWLAAEDLASSRVFKHSRSPAVLQIGGLKPGGQPVHFAGNESLATIAGPGAGKTVAQVIPNLLTYPGSCFVLDVKGELWEKTAGYRARSFGPVFRFAPTDPSGRTHRYNPFDIIPGDAAAERECQIFASMIIPEAGGRDPFWEEKAREYLWAFAMLVAFNANPGWRTLSSVSRLLTLRTNFPNPLDFLTSDTKRILDGLRELATRIGIPALKQTADAFHDTMANEKMLQSVLDTARSKLGPLTRSPTALAAMAASDWSPLDLRRRPGTTVYFCLNPDEMKAYAPLVRLVFQQHVSQLIRNFTAKPGDLPVTFFLDEMPQLGFMPNMSDIIDVGRGAGVRLWMFMQYLSQMRAAYGPRGDGLINACKVRCYMSPDSEAAHAIEPLLGETRHLLSGSKKPLVTAHELAGRAFADDIITLASGEHPARLAKLNYHADPALDARSRLPPPLVAARSRPSPAPPAPATPAASQPSPSSPVAAQPASSAVAKSKATHAQSRPLSGRAPTAAPPPAVQHHANPVRQPNHP